MDTKELEEKIAEYIVNAKKDVDYFNERGEFDPNPYWMAEELVKLLGIASAVSGSYCMYCEKELKPNEAIIICKDCAK